MNPLVDIRDAIREGASTRDAITRRTGLPDSLVDAVLDHLARSGELRPPATCAGPACGGCPEQARCDGPVLLTLGTAPVAERGTMEVND